MTRRFPVSALLASAALVSTACGSPGLEPIADPDFYDPEPGVLRLDPSIRYDFGPVSPQGARARGEVRMWVEGDEPVRVVEMYLDDTTSLAFGIGEANFFPLTLEPGQEANAGIYFEPYAVGDYFGNVVVVTLDEAQGEFELTVELAGEGCVDEDADRACD